MYGGNGINGDFKGVPFLNWQVANHASSVFAGATTNAHGSLGEKPIYTIWTVTGAIYILGVVGRVNTTLTDAAGAGEINLGVTGNATFWIGAYSSDSVVAGDVLGVSTTLGTGLSGAAIGAISVDGTIWHNDGNDILETTTGADVLTGQIDYRMIWTPAEAGATVVEAGTLS